MRVPMPPTRQLPKDKRGVTSLEYGMMVALIALVVYGAVTRVGASALSLWTTVTNMHF